MFGFDLSLWMLAAGAIGVLVIIAIVYRAGRKAERARQDEARHRARDIADEVDEDVAGRSPAENRERLKSWRQGA